MDYLLVLLQYHLRKYMNLYYSTLIKIMIPSVVLELFLCFLYSLTQQWNSTCTRETEKSGTRSPLLFFVIQRQDPQQKLENGSSNSNATIADWGEEVSKHRKGVSTRQLPSMAAFSESFNKVIDVS